MTRNQRAAAIASSPLAQQILKTRQPLPVAVINHVAANAAGMTQDQRDDAWWALSAVVEEAMETGAEAARDNAQELHSVISTANQNAGISS